MKKCIMIKIIASVMAVAIGFGVIYNSGVIKSKAGESKGKIEKNCDGVYRDSQKMIKQLK